MAHGRRKKNGGALAVLLILLLCLAGLLLLATRRASGDGRSAAPVSAAADETPAADMVNLRLHVGDEVQDNVTEKGSELTLAPAEEREGYTFRGWQDVKGVWHTESTVTLTENLDLYAVYAPGLLTGDGRHEAYLTAEDGRFRPYEALQRGEAAAMLRILTAEGWPELEDFEASDPAASVTRRELHDLLSSLYTAGWTEDSLAADPEGLITRAETASLMNRLLGRTGNADAGPALTGSFCDVSAEDPYYRDIAEAAISHDGRTAGQSETWTNADALPLQSEGFQFVDKRLHYFKADGSPAVDEQIGHIGFGADGVYSTGDLALDGLLFQVLDEQVDPDTMEREEMLHTLYRYVVLNFNYLRQGTREFGETGWENESAAVMLTERRGNCYNYAATFGLLARALGYDAVMYSGSIYGENGADLGYPTKRPHGWVEIEIDGTVYIFDTDMQATVGRYSGESFYMRGDIRDQYGYTHAEDAEEEADGPVSHPKEDGL